MFNLFSIAEGYYRMHNRGAAGPRIFGIPFLAAKYCECNCCRAFREFLAGEVASGRAA